MDTILRTVLQAKADQLHGGARPIHSIGPDATLLDAARLMSNTNVGCALVMQNGRLVGIISERDVLHVFADERADADKATASVASCMTSDLVTVPPSMNVEAALKLCTNRRIRHLPVVDGTELQGLLSIGDLVSFVVRDKEGTISELMDYIHGP
jgi:CBS domain-containing protein